MELREAVTVINDELRTLTTDQLYVMLGSACVRAHGKDWDANEQAIYGLAVEQINFILDERAFEQA